MTTTWRKKLKSVQDSVKNLSRFTCPRSWSNDIGAYLKDNPKPKILIIQPSRIGDVIFSMPTASALRMQFPHAWIGWFVDERCKPIIEGNPDIDEIIVFDRQKNSLKYLMELYKYLHKKKIDLSIDLHGLFKSVLMVQLAGARFRIASASTRGMKELSWLFSREIRPEREDSHCVERHLTVARYLGCKTQEIEYHIRVDDLHRKRVAEILKQKNADRDKPLVVIHPGGGWISRRWFPERFAALSEKLISESGVQVVLVGGKEGGAGEKGLNEEIASLVKRPIVDLTGILNLKELAALLLKSNLFIGNEAGPMHLAVALNVPVLALIGPTNPHRTGPFGGRTKIIRHEIECQPCRQRSCRSRKCMELITVDEVFNTAREML